MKNSWYIVNFDQDEGKGLGFLFFRYNLTDKQIMYHVKNLLTMHIFYFKENYTTWAATQDIRDKREIPESKIILQLITKLILNVWYIKLDKLMNKLSLIFLFSLPWKQT